MQSANNEQSGNGIAVIGVGCRFPHADNPMEFWDFLANGRTAFGPVPDNRPWSPFGANMADLKGAFLDHPFRFDPGFFNIPAAEAPWIDPQQRIMLELAVEAMEAGGYTDIKGRRAAVFIGANHMAYEEMLTTRWYKEKLVNDLRDLPGFRNLPEELRTALEADLESASRVEPIPPNGMVGNLANMIAGRISHELNLKGPSLSVDTACSSSLVAVHLACQSLDRQECDLAFAGGVNLNLTPTVFHYMIAAGAVSPSGRCIPFSQESDGILLGEGAGMVLLKRLADAQRDGNPVLAVIRGSGMNNDGRTLSPMAPGWKGQLALLETTYRNAGYDPARISAVEAHGTSTRIGDGVELSVIERFFPRPAGHPVSVGSVKSNIGHTLGAAGIAGMIKMLLALNFRRLPPSVSRHPDPKWKLAEKGIRIQPQLEDWQTDGLRAAGISSFGFGGTNAHIILEESPAPVPEWPVHKTHFSRQSYSLDFFPKPSRRLLCSLEWRPAAAIRFGPDFQPDSWIVFCNPGPVKTGLLAYFQSRETRYRFVQNADPEERTPAFSRTGEYDYAMDPDNPDHYRWLLSGAGAEKTGILWLADPVENDTGSLIHRQLPAIARLFGAVHDSKIRARIWVMTFNAFTAPVAPGQRAIAALASGALAENDHLRGGLLDCPGTDPPTLRKTFEQLGKIASQPMVLDAGGYVEPVLSPLKFNAAGTSRGIRSGGIYLIIGGSSGVGAEIAGHLAAKHRAAVIITGTRRPEDLPPALQQMPYFQVSVTDGEALDHLLMTVIDRFGPIDGIVFAAGVIRYGPLAKAVPEALKKTIAVKIGGATRLAQAVRGKSVGWVYLISSVAGLSPRWNKGLAGYAAANAWLDAFAATQTTPATRWLACSWGIWKDTGMAASLTALDHRALSVSEALRSFDESLGNEYAHLIALPATEQAHFTLAWPEAPAGTADKETARESNDTAVVSESAPLPESTDTRTIIRELLSQTLEIPVAEIDDEETFYNLGLDSLSAVDLVKKFESITGLTLTPTLLFEHDSVALLTRYISAARDQLSTLRSQTADPGSDRPEPVETLMLASSQQTFYASHVFYPDAPCNMVVSALSDRQFDRKTLEIAWNHLIRRHDSLRMAFHTGHEGPLQTVRAVPPQAVVYHRASDRQEAEAQLNDLEESLANEIFPLDRPPLMRMVYLDFDAGGSSILLGVHHIIADAWSVHLLLKELLEGVNRLASGGDLDELPPPVSFRDYIRQTATRPRVNPDLAFWREELRDAVFSIQLPYRPAPSDARHQAVFGKLTEAETRIFLEKAKSWNVTPFHLLVSAYFLSLYRQSKQHDLIIRVAAANRESAFRGIDQLVGSLADSLPLRIGIQPDDHLHTVAQRVRARMLEVGKHPVPASAELSGLQTERRQNGPAGISPAGISFIPFDHLNKYGDLDLADFRARVALPFTDLSLICALIRNRLVFSWNYSTAHFDRDTVSGFQSGYLSILKDLSADKAAAGPDPRNPPLELPVVDLFPESGLLHQKVWAACEQFAGSPALVDRGAIMTYHALRQRSERLARALAGLSTGGPKICGILAYPGVEAVCGILGILASGRAFVPFDPDWPDGRMAAMIRHSGLDIMVTSGDQAARFSSGTELGGLLKRIVLTDQKVDVPENGNGSPAQVSPDDPAYIMYTSGTTGRPKGVVVSHRAVSVFLNWIAETFSISREDRFVHTSSLGFGGSIRQVFSTLLAGGTIYPIPRTELKDPHSLLDFLIRHEITLLNTVPTVLTNLLEWLAHTPDDSPNDRPQKLRLILVGGEALSARTVRNWYDRFGSRPVIVNLYGSTETIVNATLFFTDPAAPQTTGVIPLGYQKKGSIVRLIGESGQLCRPGETGELYVGGPAIADGYYLEEALTKERFVHLDHLGETGIFYRTGDLARCDEKGCYHYLGRSDDQIQVYGNRVEPMEIEQVLYQFPEVKNAAVVDFASDDEHRLIAFVALSPASRAVLPAEIRNLAAAKLPAYMVPHQVILLDKMPLNHAGKTDRAELRRQYAGLFSRVNRETAPSASEQQVAAIWEAVLLISGIKPEDDFFVIGGDSILAIKMHFHLRRHFGRVPRPVDLFRFRSVRSLAREIDRLAGLPADNGSPGLQPAPDRMPVLSPAQKGFLLLRKLNPASSPNWVTMIRLNGHSDPVALQNALDFLMKRHAVLRTIFKADNSGVYPLVLEDATFPLEYLEISRPSRVFEALKEKKFDPGVFPLFAAQLVRADDNRFYLGLSMHHIVGDAWSLQLLCAEMLEVYDQILDGALPDLPPMRTTYADAAAWIHAMEKKISPEEVADRQAFWRKSLSGVPLSALPGPGHGAENSAVAPDTLVISGPEAEQLRTFCERRRTRLFPLLLGLFARALGQLYATRDLLISVPVSGRDIPLEGAAQIVGCFARNLPVRIMLPQEDDLGSVPEVVDAAFSDALANQDIPANAFFKTIAEANPGYLYAVNRFFFSYMDFTAIPGYEGRHMSIDWSGSDIYFNAGDAKVEMMAGVRVDRDIRISLHGEAPDWAKSKLKMLWEQEIKGLAPNPVSLDTALIAYLPGMRSIERLLSGHPAAVETARMLVTRFKNGQGPQLAEIVETPLGNTGLFFLPMDADDLDSAQREPIVRQTEAAITAAASAGARIISLAGMLPSRTNYGLALNTGGVCTLTTGHSCTVSAVIKTVEQALRVLDLDISKLNLSVIGFGSIGQASLSLLLQALGKPAGITITDLPEQLPFLEARMAELEHRHGVQLRFAPAEHGLAPEPAYAADLIIGASSSGNTLDVARFRPGTILVDDSFPAIVRTDTAIERMLKAGDVLLTGGGKLTPGMQVRHFQDTDIPEGLIRELIRQAGETGLPGCRLEPLLMMADPGLPPTIGLVTPENALLYWKTINRLGIEAAPFHQAGFVIPESVILKLRRLRE